MRRFLRHANSVGQRKKRSRLFVFLAFAERSLYKVYKKKGKCSKGRDEPTYLLVRSFFLFQFFLSYFFPKLLDIDGKRRRLITRLFEEDK